MDSSLASEDAGGGDARSPMPRLDFARLNERPPGASTASASAQTQHGRPRQPSVSPEPPRPSKRNDKLKLARLNRLDKPTLNKVSRSVQTSQVKSWLHNHGCVVKADKLHPAVQRVIAEWFDLVDDDGSRTLEHHELLAALKAAHIPCDDDTIQEMIGLMDFNADGVIGWEEFEVFMTEEFAAGKNLLSGEYLLPSGLSINFGVMISKLKRSKLMGDIMQNGQARSKWADVARNPNLMNKELALMQEAVAATNLSLESSSKGDQADQAALTPRTQLTAAMLRGRDAPSPAPSRRTERSPSRGSIAGPQRVQAGAAADPLAQALLGAAGAAMAQRSASPVPAGAFASGRASPAPGHGPAPPPGTAPLLSSQRSQRRFSIEPMLQGVVGAAPDTLRRHSHEPHQQHLYQQQQQQQQVSSATAGLDANRYNASPEPGYLAGAAAYATNRKYSRTISMVGQLASERNASSSSRSASPMPACSSGALQPHADPATAPAAPPATAEALLEAARRLTLDGRGSTYGNAMLPIIPDPTQLSSFVTSAVSVHASRPAPAGAASASAAAAAAVPPAASGGSSSGGVDELDLALSSRLTPGAAAAIAKAINRYGANSSLGFAPTTRLQQQQLQPQASANLAVVGHVSSSNGFADLRSHSSLDLYSHGANGIGAPPLPLDPVVLLSERKALVRQLTGSGMAGQRSTRASSSGADASSTDAAESGPEWISYGQQCATATAPTPIAVAAAHAGFSSGLRRPTGSDSHGCAAGASAGAAQLAPPAGGASPFTSPYTSPGVHPPLHPRHLSLQQHPSSGLNASGSSSQQPSRSNTGLGPAPCNGLSVQVSGGSASLSFTAGTRSPTAAAASQGLSPMAHRRQQQQQQGAEHSTGGGPMSGREASGRDAVGRVGPWEDGDLIDDEVASLLGHTQAMTSWLSRPTVGPQASGAGGGVAAWLPDPSAMPAPAPTSSAGQGTAGRPLPRTSSGMAYSSAPQVALPRLHTTMGFAPQPLAASSLGGAPTPGGAPPAPAPCTDGRCASPSGRAGAPSSVRRAPSRSVSLSRMGREQEGWKASTASLLQQRLSKNLADANGRCG